MITLIVPCYNEQESLPIFYKEVTAVVQKIKSDYELLFINELSMVPETILSQSCGALQRRILT